MARLLTAARVELSWSGPHRPDMAPYSHLDGDRRLPERRFHHPDVESERATHDEEPSLSRAAGCRRRRAPDRRPRTLRVFVPGLSELTDGRESRRADRLRGG